MTVEQVVAMAREYYLDHDNPTGGYLHVVLDDGNVGDADVKFCLMEADRGGDDAAVALGWALLGLTEEERERVYEQYDRYSRWSP